MNMKTLATGIVATVILILLASAVLVPVVSDAQKVAGEPISKNNAIVEPYRLIENGDRIEIDITYSTGIINFTVNGTAYDLSSVSNANANLLLSDSLSINRNADGTVVTVSTSEGDSTNSYEKHVIFDSGVVTYTIPTQSYTWTGSYSWAYVLDVNGDYGNHPGNAGAYVNTIKDIAASGYYSTGENDCYYTLKDGTITNSGGYEGSVTYDLALIDGTTDIYELSNLKIHIGNEEFTPYRILVKDTIDGHEDHGANYSLIGVIPLIVFVGIILGVVGMFISRRD